LEAYIISGKYKELYVNLINHVR